MAKASFQIIKGLNAYEYQHPFDSKALEAFDKIPGAKPITEKFNELGLEKMLLTAHKGNNIRLSAEFYPGTYNILAQTAKILNHSIIPDLYCTRSINMNGTTVGVLNPLIVISSLALDWFKESPRNIVFLMGKEMGHIKSNHVLYLQVAAAFPMIAELLEKPTLGVSHFVSKPLQYALYHWQQMATFTADRAGLLACQDINTAIQTLMMMAGLPRSFLGKVGIKSFIQQAKEFEQMDYDSLNKWIKFFVNLDNKSPWAVLRAGELMKWYDSGDYQKILERKVGGIFCGKCGNPINPTSQFCGICGESI